MASVTTTVTTAAAAAAVGKEREGAEVVSGAVECFKQSMELMRALGFPEGMMPLRGLEECGLVRETGFVWMRQRAPYEHYFRGTGTRVRYDVEVTAFVEEGRMKRMTGVRSKQLMLWVPIVEMSLDGADRVYFKSNVGIGRSFPASAFADETAAAAAFLKEADAAAAAAAAGEKEAAATAAAVTANE